MKAVYDPDVIQEFSDRLYKKAKGIIQSYTALGAIFVGFAGLAAGGPIFGCIGTITGGVVGYSLGIEKAFIHKLQAQQPFAKCK